MVYLEGRVTAIQTKVDLSDRLHPVMKPFHPAGSGFFSRMASLSVCLLFFFFFVLTCNRMGSCMCTNLWPLELEVSSRLLSLIRLQKWVCSLSPLSPACLPLPRPLSNSFCLPQFLLPLRLSLSGYRSLKVCVIQASPSGNATDHLSPALLFSHLSMFLALLPFFLCPISRQHLTGNSPTAGPQSLQEAGCHVTPP